MGQAVGARTRVRAGALVMVTASSPQPYQGVRYHLQPARVAAQRLWPARAQALGLGALKLESLAPPLLPAGGNWVELLPVWSGICGSDVGIITGTASAYLAPVTAFPAVLGHEIAARRADTQEAVVVDPSLGCHARGLPPCRACEAGVFDGCERHADAALGRGLLLGYHGRLPGGWATRMWAPAAQLHSIPAALPLRRAVLAEPLAIVLAGLARAEASLGGTVLVLGAGTLGLLATWALASGGAREVIVQARHPHQGDLALLVGAHRVVHGSHEERAAMAGAPLGRPLLGAPPLHPWGVDAVVDTVGSRHTLAEALAITRPGGSVLVLGAASRPPADLAPVWTRSLRVLGTYGYHAAGQNHLPAAIRGLAAAPVLDALITHAHPLEQYREALPTPALHRAGAIKSVFAIAPEARALLRSGGPLR